MISAECVEVGSVDDFVGRRIREIGVVLCQPNGSFIDCVRRIIDEVEGFPHRLLCLSFCRHFANVGCGVAFSNAHFLTKRTEKAKDEGKAFGKGKGEKGKRVRGEV